MAKPKTKETASSARWWRRSVRARQRKWSESEHAILRTWLDGVSLKVIAARLGRSHAAIKSRVGILGLKRGNHRAFTPAQLATMRKFFPFRSSADVAAMVGRERGPVERKAHKLGLRKDPAYLERCLRECGRHVNESGKANRFPKGHVPANKGKRRPGWNVGRMKETQFVKGRQPANTLPVGTVKANADGYLRIKVYAKANGRGANDKAWEFVHVRVWTAAHGPVPRGHRIWWKDRNHANCALENLELLSDAEHMKRTTIHNWPPELKQVAQLTGALNRKINRLAKQKGSDGKSTERPTETSSSRSESAPVLSA